MLKHNSILKCSLFFVFALTNVFAIDVIVAKQNIKLKEKIALKNLRHKKVNKVKKSCIPITLNKISNTIYIAKHYINVGSVICEKDIKIHKKNTVLFNFGNIEIEKEGKVVGETTKYIRVKKPSGKIEKIYKDGSIK